ncbi:hypothetical protein Efla_007576 [Eimeria flavescens]
MGSRFSKQAMQPPHNGQAQELFEAQPLYMGDPTCSSMSCNPESDLSDVRGQRTGFELPVTQANAQVSCLMEELRALEMRLLSMQETNQLMLNEMDKLKRPQRLSQKEQGQHDETRHKLLAAEADAEKIRLLEQQIMELRRHKTALERSQLNEAKTRSEVALEVSVREAYQFIGALKAAPSCD